MSALTGSPNDTANELDNIRKQRIKDAYSSNKNMDTEGKNKKDEKKLDNDQKNSYIKGEDDKSSDSSDKSDDKKDKSENQTSKEERIYREQFNEDPLKAVKSWSNSQTNYNKLRREHQEALEELERLKTERQSKPNTNEEPNGKPNNSEESKLPSNTDDTSYSVGEAELSKAGYIDASDKSHYSDSEWNQLVLEAKYAYLDKEMPNRIAQKTMKQIQEAQAKQEEENRKKENQRINRERYNKGFNTLVEDYGLDFAGNEEHEKLLDEIEAEAAVLRDRRNPDLLKENAMEIAAREVFREKGLKFPSQENSSNSKDDIKKETFEDDGFNRKNDRRSEEKKPETWGDALRKRRLDGYKQSMEYRRQTNRITNK